MEKRFQSIDSMVNVTILIVLTSSQLQKLENEDLRPRIDNLARDFHLDWAVETNGNVHQAALSRVCGPVVGSNEAHEIEIAADNFMSAVDKMELPLIKFDKTEDETQNDETLGFVKTLLNDMNLPKDNDSHVRGALIIDRSTDSFCTELTCWGRMGYDLLKEMCQLYIKAHDHE